jgi:subtilisin family serine protease
MLRRSLLALSLSVALATPVASAVAGTAAVSADGRATWIVRFVEPALASYAGEEVVAKSNGATLAATSPKATGELRLDVDSRASRAYLAELAQRREARLDAASLAVGRELEPLFVYDAVLNGVALSLTAAEAQALARVPGVAAVEREHVDQLQDDVSTAWIKAPDLWTGVAGASSRGAGVVVGVIDSGINAAHPSFAGTAPVDGFVHTNPRGFALGLCASGQATCTSKLIGIWDLTTGGNDTEPNNGLDTGGHGTHVAGTAVGNEVPIVRSFAGGGQVSYSIRGVAPRANLISYKACEGEDVGCPGSWTLAALNQAVRDGVDVINYSIGGSNTSPWSRSDSLAMLDARNAGIVVAVAAGNRGPDVGTVTSPSDSPWVLSVANSSHGRRFVNRLRLSGGGSAPPLGGVIDGQGLTGPAGPAPLARDPLQPLCSQGSGDQALPVNGASNPWPAGRWNGQIVVCDRGVQARVAKSNNVRLAGGSGTLLLNTAAEGESTVADEHSIPTTHIGFSAAQAVLQWLASGSGHTARIDGAQIEVLPANADIIATSSGRGPSSVLPGVIKPDLAAPGSSIQSADNDTIGDATLSGTSMASPHVAGAAALLRGARPSWRADEIISALMTTARPVVVRTAGGAALPPYAQGTGRIDLARAVQAGLAFNVGAGEFAAASGEPAALNLPSLVFDRCAPSCGTLSRTVTDLVGGGTWRASFSGPAGVTVTVSEPEFTLGAGARRTLAFNATISDPGLYGRWLHGIVTLTRQGAGEAGEMRVPVVLRAPVSGLPAAQTRSVAADRGHFDFTLPALSLPMPDARFVGTRLVPLTATSYTLTADPTPSDRYDNLTNGVGWHLATVPVPASGNPTRYRIEVDLQVPGGTQTSLIVGNGGGPGSRNQLCESATRCVLDVEHPGDGPAQSYWMMVWNRSGSGTFTVTHSVLPMVAATDADAARLAVTGPGSTTTAQTSRLRIGWNDPSWPVGEVRRGAVMVFAAPGTMPMGVVPITFTRTAGDPAAQALGSGLEHALGLPANGIHERLFIDVPAGATELRVVSSSAANLDLHLARRAFPAPDVGTPEAAAAPLIAAAPPRGEASHAATGPTGNEQVVVVNPQAGRWYVTPVNATAAPISARVTATVTGSAPLVRSGSYFNPARSGHGLFLYPAGSQISGIWYTYLQDGTPTWYFMQAAAPGANGLWRSPVFRSAWNGRSNVLTAVGEATVVPTGPDAFNFTYTLDGETGSEPLTAFGRGCPSIGGAAIDGSGHWFDPVRAGTGYSVQLFPNYEFYAVFAYDDRGVPRYLLAERTSMGGATETVNLDQMTGFCPLCTRSANPQRTTIGTLSRTFAGGTLQRIQPSGTFSGGVSGTWAANDAVGPLGSTQGCATP